MRKGPNPSKDKNSGNGLVANESIRAREVQLITEEGENLGIISRDEALERAQRVGLDLVMLSESGGKGVPVVKIMDYGKELYNRKKKQSEAKKTQKIIQIKEIKIRPKIGQHDYETKMKRGIEFLEEGKRVKFTLLFRGREMATKYERGLLLFSKIEETLAKDGLLDRLTQEKESKAGLTWSKIYYIKKA
jgi:translation initiation factor IF-3